MNMRLSRNLIFRPQRRRVDSAPYPGAHAQPTVWFALPQLVRRLALAALVEWLIGRTLTRGVHFIPKVSPVLEAYQGLTLLGQFAFTLTGVLALVTLGWIAWRMRGERRGLFSVILAVLGVSSVLFVFLAPTGWMTVAFHTLLLGGLILIVAQAHDARRLAIVTLPAAVMIVGELYALSNALGNALHTQEALPWSIPLYNAGELIVLIVPLVLWWHYARGRARGWMYVIAALPAVLFAVAYLRSPALTGIVAMWSLGLSLYLPWVLYAVSAWLVGVTLLTLWRRNQNASQTVWALVLLIAAGFAPPLTTQMFVGLIALWWLARPAMEHRIANAG